MINENTIEIHESRPINFDPKVEVAACYIVIEGKLLLLQRAAEKSEPGKWGVPAGKIEKNENPEKGAIRELFEETGITLNHGSQIESQGQLYIRKPEVDFIYHLFRVQLEYTPTVILNNEHQNYVWATLKDIETLPLMAGAKAAYKKFGRVL